MMANLFDGVDIPLYALLIPLAIHSSSAQCVITSDLHFRADGSLFGSLLHA